MKKVVAMTLIVLLCTIFKIAVFASPETITPGDMGNNSGLIVITNPQNQKASTFEKSYIISGYGKEGVVVTLYTYSPDSGIYKKLYINDAPASMTIGASGLFMKSVGLGQGKQYMMVRAEAPDGTYQLIKLELTHLSYNIIDLIKGMTIKV